MIYESNIILDFLSFFQPLGEGIIFWLIIKNDILYTSFYHWLNFYRQVYNGRLLIYWHRLYNKKHAYSFKIFWQTPFYYLWDNGDITQFFKWYCRNFFYQLEKDLYLLIFTPKTNKHRGSNLKLNSFFLSNLVTLLKFTSFLLILITILLYGRFNTNYLTRTNSITISKFMILLETEEEIGSVDDSLIFILLFLLIFGWYFLINISYLINYKLSLVYIIGGFITLICFSLLIPVGVFLDFGLSFITYIRGVGTVGNIFIESLLDIVSTLVIFFRFLIQNFRFILVFGVYTELFESLYTSSSTYLFQYLFYLDSEVFFYCLSSSFIHISYLFSLLFLSFLNYFYYFIHWAIVLFMQFTIYFLISFWLFFFLFTSFFLEKYEKIFFFKKYL